MPSLQRLLSPLQRYPIGYGSIAIATFVACAWDDNYAYLAAILPSILVIVLALARFMGVVFSIWLFPIILTITSVGIHIMCFFGSSDPGFSLGISVFLPFLLVFAIITSSSPTHTTSSPRVTGLSSLFPHGTFFIPVTKRTTRLMILILTSVNFIAFAILVLAYSPVPLTRQQIFAYTVLSTAAVSLAMNTQHTSNRTLVALRKQVNAAERKLASVSDTALTVRVAVSSAQQHLADILRLLDAAVLEVDGRGTIVYATPFAKCLLLNGYSEGPNGKKRNLVAAMTASALPFVVAGATTTAPYENGDGDRDVIEDLLRVSHYSFVHPDDLPLVSDVCDRLMLHAENVLRTDTMIPSVSSERSPGLSVRNGDILETRCPSVRLRFRRLRRGLRGGNSTPQSDVVWVESEIHVLLRRRILYPGATRPVRVGEPTLLFIERDITADLRVGHALPDVMSWSPTQQQQHVPASLSSSGDSIHNAHAASPALNNNIIITAETVRAGVVSGAILTMANYDNRKHIAFANTSVYGRTGGFSKPITLPSFLPIQAQGGTSDAPLPSSAPSGYTQTASASRSFIYDAHYERSMYTSLACLESAFAGVFAVTRSAISVWPTVVSIAPTIPALGSSSSNSSASLAPPSTSQKEALQEVENTLLAAQDAASKGMLLAADALSMSRFRCQHLPVTPSGLIPIRNMIALATLIARRKSSAVRGRRPQRIQTNISELLPEIIKGDQVLTFALFDALLSSACDMSHSGTIDVQVTRGEPVQLPNPATITSTGKYEEVNTETLRIEVMFGASETGGIDAVAKALAADCLAIGNSEIDRGTFSAVPVNMLDPRSPRSRNISDIIASSASAATLLPLVRHIVLCLGGTVVAGTDAPLRDGVAENGQHNQSAARVVCQIDIPTPPLYRPITGGPTCPEYEMVISGMNEAFLDSVPYVAVEFPTTANKDKNITNLSGIAMGTHPKTQAPFEANKATSDNNNYGSNINSDKNSSQLPPVREKINAAETTGVRVLFVDDDPLNRKLGAKMLNRLGCIHEEIDDGDGVLQAVEAQAQQGTPFDVILMDILMTRVNGIDACVLVKNAGHNDIAVVAMTGYVDDISRYNIFDVILRKPFDVRAMQRAILDSKARHASKEKAKTQLVPIE